MAKARTNLKRPGRTKSSRHQTGLQPDALDHAVVLIETVCCLAGDEHLIGDQSSPEIKRLRRAIVEKKSPYLFEQLMVAFSMQGISDHAAYTYMERHGRLTWRDLERATSRRTGADVTFARTGHCRPRCLLSDARSPRCGALTLVGWLAIGADPAYMVERLVTVLVIACPHALGLAVPLVVAISTTLGARNGLLVRDRRGLEEARLLNAVVFDKTDTLTLGAHRVVGEQAAAGVDVSEALRLAAGIEQDAEHPVARAIATSATERGLTVPRVAGFEAIPGHGVRADLDGRRLAVGGPTLRLAADVRRAYYRAVAANELVGLLTDAKATAESTAQLASKLGETGSLNKLDQAREQVFYAETTADLATARQEATSSRERLIRLLGLWDGDLGFRIPKQLPALPKRPQSLPSIEVDAVTHRIDLQIARMELDTLAKSLNLGTHDVATMTHRLGVRWVKMSGLCIHDLHTAVVG